MTIAFSSISLPNRSEKPRTEGLTMLLDKRLSLNELENLLNVAGNYIDIVKFGWGTSRVFPQQVVKQKINLLNNNQILVGPGGTLFEVAFAQNKIDEFLNDAKELRFTYIEISDGTVKIPHETKLECIKKAKEYGFEVFSEIGKKDPVNDKRYTLDEKIENAQKELDAGSSHIILESRESGTVGVFDSEGKVIPEYVERFTSEIGLNKIIFEAPQKQQQEWLITNLGTSVNLGNIAPEDCINLETLRCGLRSDTLKQFHMEKISIFIENGVIGAVKAASRNDIIIVVDALRATSTIITALAEGIKSVKPVTSAAECVGEMTAGERGGSKIPNLDYDNSPFVYLNKKHQGKELVITATNGTECIKTAGISKSPILIGGLINAKAVASKALELAQKNNKNISIVMAGRNNRLAKEDLISATEIIENLPNCEVKGVLKPMYSNDIVRDFLESDSGKNLVSLDKREDVLFCAKKDHYNVVPIYNEGIITL